MLTIGQLASLAGVTTKAVRHYHKLGLLEEPGRDGSGYRRYRTEHAIVLVKIKTLADAGVPLARVRELLASDRDHFDTAIAEIDRGLLRRMEKLQLARERLRTLNAGDRLFVSSDVAAYLERLRAIGVSQRTVASERDMWMLVQAVASEDAAVWITTKREAIEDPEFRELYLACDAALDWSPNDPRLDDLARRMVRWQSRQHPVKPGQAIRESEVLALVRSSPLNASPAWARLQDMVRRRGVDDADG